jgi:hypothetical protein
LGLWLPTFLLPGKVLQDLGAAPESTLSRHVEDPDLQRDLGLDPEAMPANWEAGRRRYFTINWIQLAVTWSAFALFLLALISL